MPAPASSPQQPTLVADWDARMPRVGAILDGPSDYITKALGTFEAPAVPVPAHVVTTSTAAPWRARPCSRRSHATA